MTENQPTSYASPISFTRATPFVYSIVSERQTVWGTCLAWVVAIPALLILWVLLTVYYLLAFSLFLVPFLVWRLWRRNERRKDQYHADMMNAQSRAAWDAWNAQQRQNGGRNDG